MYYPFLEIFIDRLKFSMLQYVGDGSISESLVGSILSSPHSFDLPPIKTLHSSQTYTTTNLA